MHPALPLALFALAAPAKKEAVLVLNLAGQGLPVEVADALDAAVRDEVKAVPGVELLPKPALDFEGMKLAAGCTEDGPACLRTIGQTVGAGRVVSASYEGSPERITVRLLVVHVPSRREETSILELSDVGADSAVELSVRVASLFGVKKVPPPGAIGLAVKSDTQHLDAADLLLDDKKVDLAGLKEVPPGRHRLEVRLAGHETFIWIGMVRPGRTTQVSVQLVPSKPVEVAATPEIGAPPAEEAPPPAQPKAPALPKVEGQVVEHDGPPPRIATWILGGAAIAAAAIGTVQGLRVLAIENDLSERCDEDGNCIPDACRPHPGDCSDADTAAVIANVSFGLAGALAAASVIAFFLEDGDDGDVQASVGPTPDGAHATLRLRF